MYTDYYEEEEQGGMPTIGYIAGILLLVFAALWVFGLFDPFEDGQTQGAKPERAQALAPAGKEFIAPYAGHYVLTQGPHGQSYGHLAIDLGAGKGAALVAPITGTITDAGTDKYGNTYIVVENERYRVLLLHGVYTVKVGQHVQIGDPVGTESNIGYTLDGNGRLCYPTRDCGYHTHLNVFDKQLGQNVNPLDLL